MPGFKALLPFSIFPFSLLVFFVFKSHSVFVMWFNFILICSCLILQHHAIKMSSLMALCSNSFLQYRPWARLFSLVLLPLTFTLFYFANLKPLSQVKGAIVVKISSIMIDKTGLKNRTDRIGTTGKRDMDDSMTGLTSNSSRRHLIDLLKQV